jgi:hypothetical protein
MAKAKTSYSILSAEQKQARLQRAKDCVKAEKAAKEAGFKGEPGRGYWKAVHAFCTKKGIPYPEAKTRKPRQKTVKKVKR